MDDTLPETKTEDSQRRCVFCGQLVARKDCHKNRYGEYICRGCQKKGKRWTHQSRFLNVSKKILRFVLIGLVGLSLASGYVWFMIKIMNQVSPSPPPAND